MAVSTTSSPNVLSKLTPEELLALTVKLDRAAAIGERSATTRRTTEIYGVQAKLYDARAHAFYGAAGMPGRGMDAEREAEAGQ